MVRERKKGVHEVSRTFDLIGIFKLSSAEMVKAVAREGFEGLEIKCSVLDTLNLK